MRPLGFRQRPYSSSTSEAQGRKQVAPLLGQPPGAPQILCTSVQTVSDGFPSTSGGARLAMAAVFEPAFLEAAALGGEASAPHAPKGAPGEAHAGEVDHGRLAYGRGGRQGTLES